MARVNSNASKKSKHLFFPEMGNTVAFLFPEFSPNEAKTVYLYTLGLSQRLIAKELGNSVHTINSYMKRAKDKINVYSFTELRQICNARINLHLLNFIQLTG